jgi:hypothetical protein
MQPDERQLDRVFAEEDVGGLEIDRAARRLLRSRGILRGQETEQQYFDACSAAKKAGVPYVVKRRAPQEFARRPVPVRVQIRRPISERRHSRRRSVTRLARRRNAARGSPSSESTSDSSHRRTAGLGVPQFVVAVGGRRAA